MDAKTGTVVYAVVAGLIALFVLAQLDKIKGE